MTTSATAAPSSPAPADNRFPPQIKYIIGNEACERFSYYGVIGILTLYVKNYLDQGSAKASEISHLFKFGVYFMPLFGAWLSDRVLGRYKTILYISFFYCAGHGLMALADLFCPLTPRPAEAGAALEAWKQLNAGSINGRMWFLFGGLTLLSLGGGGIKPCVSAFVGDQFKSNQQHLLERAYGLFYWSINFGSFFSFIVVPRVAEKHGYGWAFGIPGIFMGLATLIFWLGSRHYQHVPPSRANNSGGFWEMLGHALTHLGDRRPGRGFWDACHTRFTEEQIEAARAATRVAGVFALIPFFWALWDQNSTSWVIQGEKMEPYIFPEALMKSFLGPVMDVIVGPKLGAEQMQSLNALFVMITIPVLSYGVFPFLRKLGILPTTLRRMGTGMFLCAASFLLIAWIEERLVAGHKLNVLWQSWPYIVLTIGEVLVSNTALEFAFREAPQSMRSTLMSFWLLTVALGNLFVSQLFKLNVKERLPDGKEILHLTGTAQFLLFALLLGVVSVAFVWVTTRYKYRDPSQLNAA